MKKMLVTLLLAFPLVACGGENQAADTSASEAPRTETPAGDETTEVQVVQVTVEGMAYVFSPANVRAGVPVRLVFDPAGLPGCSKSVTLPAYDITKTIDAENSVIELTPQGPGPLAMNCTMNMYKGTLQVD